MKLNKLLYNISSTQSTTVDNHQGISPSVYYTAFLAPPHLTVIHTFYSVKRGIYFTKI